MSEHYWADGTLKGELETLLYGSVGGLLQKWQRKAIRKAMKQVDKVAELKHWLEEAHRLETCVAEVEQENLELKQDLKRIGDVLDAVKSQECQGHYSTMIQQIIDRNKELEEDASIYSWIASNCRVTYNGKTIYDEAQIKRYMENT